MKWPLRILFIIWLVAVFYTTLYFSLNSLTVQQLILKKLPIQIKHVIVQPDLTTFTALSMRSANIMTSKKIKGKIDLLDSITGRILSLKEVKVVDLEGDFSGSDIKEFLNSSKGNSTSDIVKIRRLEIVQGNFTINIKQTIIHLQDVNVLARITPQQGDVTIVGNYDIENNPLLKLIINSSDKINVSLKWNKGQITDSDLNLGDRLHAKIEGSWPLSIRNIKLSILSYKNPDLKIQKYDLIGLELKALIFQIQGWTGLLKLKELKIHTLRIDKNVIPVELNATAESYIELLKGISIKSTAKSPFFSMEITGKTPKPLDFSRIILKFKAQNIKGSLIKLLNLKQNIDDNSLWSLAAQVKVDLSPLKISVISVNWAPQWLQDL